jgi:indole-3-glycerol phosphate synthase
MEPLVEVRTEDELARALRAGAKIVGINNRDLATFSVDISTTIRLSKKTPKKATIVSESGIESVEDIKRLAAAGVRAFLVGEALVRAKDIAKKLRELSAASFGQESAVAQ